jgi:hypothetical protein
MLLLALAVQANASGTTITSGPEDGEVVTVDTVTFTFTSDDPEATYACSLDGGGFRSCTSPVVLSDLDDGTHIFLVRSMGGPSDVSQDSRRFKVNTQDPPVGPGAKCTAARNSAKAAKTNLKKAKAKKARTTAAKKAKRKAIARAKAALRRANAKVAAAC